MILDTCFVSELWRKKPDPAVIAWFDDVDDAALRLSAVTVGELAEGAARIANAARRREVEDRIAAFRRDFAARILPIDEEVGARWGALRGEQARRGRVLPAIDALIAATALHHDLPIVTRNAADFHDLGVVVINPWRS